MSRTKMLDHHFGLFNIYRINGIEEQYITLTLQDMILHRVYIFILYLTVTNGVHSVLCEVQWSRSN